MDFLVEKSLPNSECVNLFNLTPCLLIKLFRPSFCSAKLIFYSLDTPTLCVSVFYHWLVK
jgi:hypothetical protein